MTTHQVETGPQAVEGEAVPPGNRPRTVTVADRDSSRRDGPTETQDHP